ncbi:MAG: hypothetical protein U0270_29115 [Labilithrix sp.]
MSRKDIGDAIKARAKLRGLTNPLLFAGIAQHETNLAHCVADYYVQKCMQSAGIPSSASCHGGSVVIGNADATCDDGGMGLFQLDAGTQADTVAKYGADVVELDGNIDHGIEHVLGDVIACGLGADVAAAAIWLNAAVHGTADYDRFFTCVARQYNGCKSENGCDEAKRAGQYRSATESIAREFGLTYWTPKEK